MKLTNTILVSAAFGDMSRQNRLTNNLVFHNRRRLQTPVEKTIIQEEKQLKSESISFNLRSFQNYMYNKFGATIRPLDDQYYQDNWYIQHFENVQPDLKKLRKARYKKNMNHWA